MTVEEVDNTMTASSLQLLSATCKVRYKANAMHLLWVSDRRNYTPFMDDLWNEFLKWHNNYPATVSDAYILLLRYRSDSTTYR